MASALFIAILIASFAIFYRLSVKLDVNKVVYNHRPGVCREIFGPVDGSEDIEIIQSEGLVFVTSGVVCWNGKCPPGKIFLYDIKQNSATAKELKITGNKLDLANFFPHGLTHWRMPNGIIRLYLLNHNTKFEHSVEIFDFDSKGMSLIHKRTIKDEALIRPNGIVAAGPDQFFHTNDGTAQSVVLNSLQILAGWKAGSVFYYDGKKFHNILDGKGSANGIAYDIERRKLFVTMITDRTVDVYDISQDRLSAKEISRFPVYSGCDNLVLDADGSLYTGCHPIMYLAARHIKNCSNEEVNAPSQILRLRFDDSYKNAAITEIYSNDGSEISASSVGAVYRNKLIIGSVCRNLLECDIVAPSVL